MKKTTLAVNIFCLLILTVIPNCYLLVAKEIRLLYLLFPLFVASNVFLGSLGYNTGSFRLRVCKHGVFTLVCFLMTSGISLTYHSYLAVRLIPGDYMQFIWSAVTAIVIESIVFWNGIICVYLTSARLGIKLRVKGAVFGMVPILNIVMLKRIIKIVKNEVETEIRLEKEKERLNESRKDQQICKTKYPILLVHGLFFRDYRYFNYWGRIPAELEKNGAKIYYGKQESAAPIVANAAELTARVKDIVARLGCEKVNIIAHSKGGLDCRYALSELDLAPYVASLTTINTPHKGCIFADYLLNKIPDNVINKICKTYNKTLTGLGDKNADFLEASRNLTASYCTEFNERIKDPDGVFCQSFGSRLNKASGGKFPLNFSYHLVSCFDGDNDGLVSVTSFEWGERFTLLTVNGDRGISHGDMIDLNRENMDEFDVREFYVQIVNDLKQRGF